MMTTTILELGYDAALINMLDAVYDLLNQRGALTDNAARARDLLRGMGLPCHCTIAVIEGRSEYVTCEMHELSFLLLEMQCTR